MSKKNNTLPEQKVTAEQAEREINGWLDRKKIFNSTRDDHEASIRVLVDAIMFGCLILNEDDTFTHNLLFPIEGESASTDVLTYKSRINFRMLEPYLKGVANNDGSGRVFAHLACLTGVAKGILKNLDPADRRISDAIVVFFIT